MAKIMGLKKMGKKIHVNSVKKMISRTSREEVNGEQRKRRIRMIKFKKNPKTSEIKKQLKNQQ
jgi:hypothetical protein